MTDILATEILICGAGAAGLTLAIELARRGVAFRLIDKLDGPFHGSRGKGIQPRTQEVFDDMGLIDRVVAAGGTYPPLRSCRDDGSWQETQAVEQADPTPAEPYRMPLMLPQFLTEALLRERLAELGQRVQFGCGLAGFEQDDEGVTARLSLAGREHSVRARYLVGADGGRSMVRHALRIGFPGRTLGMRAVVADVVLTGLERDAWRRFNDADMERQIALCPLAGTGMFQLQGPVPPEGDIDLTAHGLTALIAQRTGRRDIVVESVSWASAFSMQARLAERYRVGRVLLAGDAAHVHPPTGGQGLNTSVQDAYNLGWKLAAALDGAPGRVLDSYEAERRPVAAQMLGLSAGLLEAAKAGSMRRGREVHQLDLGYRDSALSLDILKDRAGLRAGDRAPDALLRGAAGLPLRLFDLFRGTHWTLIGYGVERRLVAAPRRGLRVHAVGPRGDIVDERGLLRQAYGLDDGDWVLVRPDGYVGATGSIGAIAELEGYLERVGLASLGGAFALA